MQELGVAEAERLLAAGWRQGSVFRPNDLIPLPAGCAENAVLVVVSQSCTVVSQTWVKDPVVEIAVAVPGDKPFAKQQRGPEAVGKNYRTLLIPIAYGDTDCLAIDVYSRFFVRRDVLLQFQPDVAVGSAEAGRRIASWMGRHFTRVALPDRLVRLMKDTVLAPLEKHLRAKFGKGPIHEGVHAIWVRWEPDDEEGPYEIEFLIACENEDAANNLDALLTDTFGKEGPVRLETDGVRVSVTVTSADGTTLADIEGHSRLSFFDHFTSLAEPVA
uniref:hypothetical protein n=1 Tax=Mesorhizobium sp. WSM4875 TaxID=3038539 RepID=UPI0024E2014C|nr:hypothetical protein [Mesorhizobium sp. WSM4875]